MTRISPPDDNLITLTLPTYMWAALRGAARRCAKHDRAKAARAAPRPPGERNLDAFRADTLDQAATSIHQMLDATRNNDCVERGRTSR